MAKRQQGRRKIDLEYAKVDRWREGIKVVGSRVGDGFKYLCLAPVAYFAYHAIASLAGQTTIIDANIAIAVTGTATGVGGYYLGNRKSKGQTGELERNRETLNFLENENRRLRLRVDELEKRK